jgi:hypothetical protein
MHTEVANESDVYEDEAKFVLMHCAIWAQQPKFHVFPTTVDGNESLTSSSDRFNSSYTLDMNCQSNTKL